jgi:hypothetical protein
MFWKAGAAMPIICVLSWWGLHALWIEQGDVVWVLLILALLLISTTLYLNAFMTQHYHALGWLFLPVGMYALLQHQWILATFAWLGVSMGSSTVLFMTSIASIIWALYTERPEALLVLVPAWFVTLSRFLPTLLQCDRRSRFQILGSCGMITGRGLYRRTHSRFVTLPFIYHLMIYGQFLFLVHLMTGTIPVLYLTGLALMLLNVSFLRFADFESIVMFLASTATVEIIQHPVIQLLPSYWLVISPLPILAGISPHTWATLTVDDLPRLSPYDVTPILQKTEAFLAPVSKGERVLMAFENPGDVYENIFDGYRYMIDLPRYVASQKGCHFMPDWFAVFETNYEVAPTFWGRETATVLQNAEYWKADYVVVYQQSGTPLNACWTTAGFRPLSVFDWSECADLLRGEKPHLGPTPIWWLLKCPYSRSKEEQLEGPRPS